MSRIKSTTITPANPDSRIAVVYQHKGDFFGDVHTVLSWKTEIVEITLRNGRTRDVAYIDPVCVFGDLKSNTVEWGYVRPDGMIETSHHMHLYESLDDFISTYVVWPEMQHD